MAHELERDDGDEAGKEVAAGPEGVVPEWGGDVVGSWRNFLKSAVVALAATGVYGTADGDDPKQPAAVAPAAFSASEASKGDGTETRVQRTSAKTVIIHAEDLVPEKMKVTLAQWKEIEKLMRSPGSRTNSILYSKTYNGQFDLLRDAWMKKYNKAKDPRIGPLDKTIHQHILETERCRDALLRAKERWAGDLNKELEEQGIPLRFCPGFLSQKDLQLHHPTLSPYEEPGPSSEKNVLGALGGYNRDVNDRDKETKKAIRSANASLSSKSSPFRLYLGPDGKTPLIDWKGQQRGEEAKELAAKEKPSRVRKKTSSADSGGGSK